MSKPQFVMQRIQSCNDNAKYAYERLTSTNRESAIKEALALLDTNETFNLLAKMEERSDKARYIPIDVITKIDEKHYHDELPKYSSIWLWI